MQQRRNGKQLIMIGGILIVLVLGVGFFFSHQGGGSNKASASSTQPVVVAQQTVPQGTIFKQGQSLTDLFKVKQEPSDLVPFGSYTSVNQLTALTRTPGCGPVKAAGCDGEVTVTQTIFQNSPVLTGMFSTLGQYRTGVDPAFAIPYGYVGIAVSFDAANSVIGSISAGDDVDLMATYKGPMLARDPGRYSTTQYALNDLRVISVNGPPATDSSSSSGPSLPGSSSSSNTGANAQAAAANAGGTLVLLVRYQQALVIQHLKDDGEHWTVSVVLRSAKETDIQHFKTLTVNDNWYFSKQQNPFQISPGY
jgi:Flp pilus assembly protein CpaB